MFEFKKNKRNEVERTVASLSKALTIEKKGELKWVLGLHVIRDCSERALWLSQKAYIMKICNDFALITSTSRLPSTPMEILELLAIPDNKDITDASRTLYQRKVGSLLFAAIATRPDIAFAVSQLSRFNQRPGKRHHEVADRVFHYLFQTQDYCTRYWGDSQDLSSSVFASNASFSDNTMDRKSSQGYIMKLFGRAVALRANKLDTVTTLSTEAEFWAISQTGKEAIYLSRLMQALNLVIPEALTIEFGNLQTMRLLVDKSMKLQTKLRNVDIHSHCLRQEVQRGSIHIRWVPTKEMVADGPTKALSSAQKHDFLVRMTGIENQKDFLASIKREEDTLQQLRTDPEYSEVYGFGANATWYVQGCFC